MLKQKLPVMKRERMMMIVLPTTVIHLMTVLSMTTQMPNLRISRDI